MRTELKNGMTIFSKRDDNLPITAISVWAKVGSSYETEGQFGIAHFLEHMLFRRKPSSLKQATIQSEIEGAGGYLNGATGKEITYYFAVVPRDFTEEALYLLLNLFLFPSFDQKDLLEERKVIIEEISRKNDNPADLLDDLLFEETYTAHPYGHSVLGDEETIKKMQLDTLRQFHQKYYHPANMVVSIVGDFNQKEILKGLNEKYGALEKKKTEICPGGEIKKGKREAILQKNVKQTYYTLGFAGPSVHNREHLTLDILAVILGEGASSRLINRLKEKERLVNAIGAHFYIQKQSGLFNIYAQFLPENLDKVDRCIWDEIKKIKTEPIPPDELEKAKRIIEAQFCFQHELYKDQSLANAYWECLGAENYEKDYLKKIRKITAEELKGAALKYLDLDNSVRVIIKPQKK